MANAKGRHQYREEMYFTFRGRLVDSTGWHGSAYLHPEGAIGDSKETLIYRGNKRALGVFAAKGRLADW